jgi:hypothetical protein
LFEQKKRGSGAELARNVSSEAFFAKKQELATDKKERGQSAGRLRKAIGINEQIIYASKNENQYYRSKKIFTQRFNEKY